MRFFLFVQTPCNEYRGLTHHYKTDLYGDECLLFINYFQESYLSDVGLNPTECWPLTRPSRFSLTQWAWSMDGAGSPTMDRIGSDTMSRKSRPNSSLQNCIVGEECLLFINTSQEFYLSDVRLNPTECWPLTPLLVILIYCYFLHF